jgi:hypothetical protein
MAALRPNYPRDVVVDPANLTTTIVNFILSLGTPAGNGEFPSEFTRPWRFPQQDNEGDPVNIERPATAPGPFVAGQDANTLFGATPGSVQAREDFQKAQSEEDTIRLLRTYLPLGQHLGDPQDYAAYVIAQLTRDEIDWKTTGNFNLDADRGYAYLCWDWARDRERMGVPAAFDDQGPDPRKQRAYAEPVKPGFGWDPKDIRAPTSSAFNPDDPNASVRIRYIDREPRA